MAEKRLTLRMRPGPGATQKLEFEFGASAGVFTLQQPDFAEFVECLRRGFMDVVVKSYARLEDD